MRALARYIARFFSPILCFPISFPPLFPSILPRLLALFFFSFFSLHPIRSQTTYLSNTSRLPIFLLHHYTAGFSRGLSPPKLIFILLDSLACPKINTTIYYMLHACCTLHENMHRICGSMGNKRWRRRFIFSPNRFHLSWPSSYKVPFSYINTMSSLNFLPRGLCRQNNESSCGANRRTRYDC